MEFKFNCVGTLHGLLTEVLEDPLEPLSRRKLVGAEIQGGPGLLTTTKVMIYQW